MQIGRGSALMVAVATAVALGSMGRIGEAIAGFQPTLRVGSPAPKLEVAGWVKGQPVTQFQPGRVYVVEFWATWCGPCRAAMPHLSRIQAQYGDRVTIIGVNVWENNPASVVPFVQSMGHQMAYRVAVDSVPPGFDSTEGAMARSWLTASGQQGIPAAFIVDGQGRIAWIGSPTQIDQALAQVVASNEAARH
ncbi:Redoxin domain protein [Isosphaera pallida ATCC 43644]|jgi:thiol-disulfide isomerase/thioredoxin|uniref:Redoxin domain protein n=2 Tax=Isosphaera pallida TaxID=128 RepID=E8R0M2_ISOPI|nr:Redoxin domain protein [Isosphaera pallida ATCC 43644]